MDRPRASRLVLDLRAGPAPEDRGDAPADDASAALLELSYALSDALTCDDVEETVRHWAGRRLGTSFGDVQRGGVLPASPVQASPVPASPVPASPVPASPVPASPVSAPPVPAPTTPPDATSTDLTSTDAGAVLPVDPSCAPAVVALPLSDATRPLGVLRLGWARDRQVRLDGAARHLLDQVALHTTHALRRALAHEEQRTVAHALRTAVLPEHLPQPAGWHLAAAFIPATRQPTVGGDWYDAFTLDGDRLALTVGDAAGHGLEAARVMSGLRNALRAYAVLGEGPHRVLERLDHLLARTDPDAFATAVHLEVGLDDGRVAWAGAGHPAPLVVRRANGSTAPAFARQGGPVDPPLGTPSVGTRHTANFRLRPGDSLLLYTDGLVERRERDVDAGLELLRRAAAEAPAWPGQIGAILEQLLDGVDPADDVCLLALTRRPAADQTR